MMWKWPVKSDLKLCKELLNTYEHIVYDGYKGSSPLRGLYLVNYTGVEAYGLP